MLNADSPSFNKDAYYDDLVAKSSLADLMKTASKLANGLSSLISMLQKLKADVGTLQGSRHALVYNHHHQVRRTIWLHDALLTIAIRCGRYHLASEFAYTSTSGYNDIAPTVFLRNIQAGRGSDFGNG